ncbi:MAG: metallopeptidase family protein [Caldilineae bacterium]|nr:metallopeptidase family protein [Chloroflexota bacterium]MCB9175766.1 metallopeptidase family protein [Caldilineae bacterium]
MCATRPEARLWLSADDFSELAFDALDSLPGWVHAWLSNVQVVVEDWPSRDQLDGLGFEDDDLLLGLYEGIPLTERSADYGMVLPDKVTLFRGPILTLCKTRIDVAREVKHTVVHELAHHFGIDDDRLEALGAY